MTQQTKTTTAAVAMLLAAVAAAFLPARAAAQPVTAAEAQALAAKIDLAAAKGDLSPFAAAFDEQELITRTFKGMALPPAAVEGFRRNAGLAKGIATSIEAALKQGGSYRLVRPVVGGAGAAQGGEPRPLFRFISPQGLNYHELHLHRAAGGAVRIADLFIFAAGETTSQNMRSNFGLTLSKDGGPPTPARQQELAAGGKTLAQLRQHLAAGKGPEAKAAFDKLPAVMRSMKAVGMLELNVHALLSDEEYAAAIERYRKRYPNASELDLVMVDGMLMRKDYDGALAAVDRLDKKLGGDPYLDMLRANVTAAKGDQAGAAQFLRKVVKALPWARDPYFGLVEVELTAGNHDAVAALMTAAERNAGVVWSGVETEPLFAAFAKSPAYAKWKATAAKPAAPAPGGKPLAASTRPAADDDGPTSRPAPPPSFVVETGAGGKPAGFTIKGKTYTLGSPADAILKGLGKPSETIPGPWTQHHFGDRGLTIGVDKGGKLAGFTVYFTKGDARLAATREGMRWGWHIGLVKQVYGEPTKEDAPTADVASLEYRSKQGVRLRLKFETGALTELYVDASTPSAK